jgi:hypothetical protein
MTDQLKIGDIAFGQHYQLHVDRNGMECEVIGALDTRITGCTSAAGPVVVTGYLVRWADGEKSREPPVHLRKKQPPALDGECYRVTSWDECEWRPRDVRQPELNPVGGNP